MVRDWADGNAQRWVVGGLLALVPPVTFLVKVLRTEPRWRYQIFEDDAFYYLGVARNLAHGHGSTFTGLVETNGYHPLWMLLLIPLAWLFDRPGELLLAVGVLQCLLWTAAVHQALQIGRLVGSWVSAAGALAAYAVLAVLTGHLAFDGMESAVLLPLLLLAVRLVVSADARPGSDLRVGLVLAAVCLARLDAIAAAVPLGLVCVGRDRPDRSVALRRTGLVAAPPALALGLYAIVDVVVFGVALPVSGAAKLLGAPFVNTAPVRQFLQAGDFDGRPLWFGAVALALVAGAVVATTRGPPVDDARRRLLACTLALVGGEAILLIQLTFATSYRVWPWYHYQLVVFSFGALLLVLRAAADHSEVLARRACQVLVVGLLVVTCLVTLRSEAPDYAASPPAAEFVRRELPEDTVLAMGDRAGIFGFLADRRLLHVEGLTGDVDLLRAIADHRIVDAMTDAGVDYYVHYGRRGKAVVVDGRSCRRFEEPVQGDGPKSAVVVCEDDMVFSHGPADDQLTIWRYRPERNEP